MRKRRASKSSAPKTKLRTGWQGSFWIVAIDEEPLRKTILADYHHVEAQLSTVRDELEAFETGDRPAFLRWELSKFGALLTQIRDLSNEIAEKDRLMDAIDDEAFWSGCSQVTAYRRVMEAMQNPESPIEEEDSDDYGPEEDDPSFEDDPFDEAGRPYLFGRSHLPPDFDIDEYDRQTATGKAAFRTLYENIAAMYEALTGIKPPKLKDVLQEAREKRKGADGNFEPKGQRGERPRQEASRRQSQPGSPSPPDIAAEHKEGRIKEIYRRLVRQLHPDLNRRQSARDRELWHEMQSAYRARDLERLEAVAGRLDVGLNGASSALPVQILLRMIRDLRDALKGLRGAINTARRDPAWGFRAKSANLAKYEARRRQHLETDRRRLAHELAARTAVLDDLIERANRSGRRTLKKTKPAKKPPRYQDEFSF